MKFDDLLKNQKSFLEVLEEAPASEFDFRSPIKGNSDSGNEPIELKVDMILQTMMHLGCEVQRLQEQVSFLQGYKSKLLETVQSLHTVLREKGVMDMDDFSLACEVLEQAIEERGSKTSRSLGVQ